MGYLEALVEARDAVTAADVACTLDPRELTTLPAVWIRLDGLGGPVLSGYAGKSRALITVFVLASPLDPERDHTVLEPLLATVAGVIPPMSDVRHVAVAGLPGGGTPAPAMSYTHELLIPKD